MTQGLLTGLVRLEKVRYLMSTLLVCSCLLTAHAQQAPQFTMGMLNKYNHNPAYGGMDASLSISAFIKTQWQQFPGQPRFQHITAHMPLYIANGGMGVKVYRDQIGVEQLLGFEVSFNYVYETDFGLFSGGIGAGITQMSLDGSLLRSPDGLYEGNTIIHNDPILSSTNGSGLAPALSLGVYFTNDYLEAGISVDQALSSMITLSNDQSTSFQMKRNFYGFAEYLLQYSEAIEIYPSIMLKSDLVQTQIDLSARVVYQDLYFGGLSFRGYSANTIDAVGVILGTRVNPQLSVAYAYDITLSDIRLFSDGTHELLVQYNLNKPLGIGRPERIIYNPRF